MGCLPGPLSQLYYLFVFYVYEYFCLHRGMPAEARKGCQIP